MRIRYGFPFLYGSKAEVFTGLGALSDYYYQTTTFTGLNFDVSKYNLFNAGFRYERNSLNYRQYPTEGRYRFLTAQYVIGDEDFKAGGSYRFTDVKRHQWLYLKGSWINYQPIWQNMKLGLIGEAVFGNKKFSSNYTASILRASSFTPTPHSKISFNEAFRADSYMAAGFVPLVKLNDRLHFRFEGYGFIPLQEIKKVMVENNTKAKRGNYFNSFQYMGEAALTFQLPFISVSLYANGYSFPKNNFNVGLNIGYLLFDSGFFD